MGKKVCKAIQASPQGTCQKVGTFGDSLEQDLEFITLIHDQIIDESGGSKGFHDITLVESTLVQQVVHD